MLWNTLPNQYDKPSEKTDYNNRQLKTSQLLVQNPNWKKICKVLDLKRQPDTKSCGIQMLNHLADWFHDETRTLDDRLHHLQSTEYKIKEIYDNTREWLKKPGVVSMRERSQSAKKKTNKKRKRKR